MVIRQMDESLLLAEMHDPNRFLFGYLFGKAMLDLVVGQPPEMEADLEGVVTAFIGHSLGHAAGTVSDGLNLGAVNHLFGYLKGRNQTPRSGNGRVDGYDPHISYARLFPHDLFSPFPFEVPGPLGPELPRQ